MDGVCQDPQRLEVTNREKKIQDRDYWRLMTVETPSFEGTK